jgi:uncharacterized protein (DUF1501 family)
MPRKSKPTEPRQSVSRRDFLAVGGLSVVGLSVAEQAALKRARERSGPRSCILIVMSGGPSQLETFDPKPEAPREIRGPLRSISTAISGVHFSEALPELARRADRLSVVRSLHHEAAPIHETGLQLLQTGRLVTNGVRHPSIGAMISRLLGPRGNTPPHVVLPRCLDETGVVMDRGDSAGFLGDEFAPIVLETVDVESGETSGLPRFEDQPPALREAYGDSPAGRQFLQARQLVEHGVRFVTVNMFDRLQGRVTWDAHAAPSHAPATLFDYRDTIGPQFDRACAGLLDDLQQRGLIEETLVVCAGEFGRSPQLNQQGGRDHWTSVFSAIVAGCGVPQGQVIGATDATASEPIDSPIELTQLTATIYDLLRVDRQAGLPEEWPVSALCDAEPIAALVG